MKLMLASNTISALAHCTLFLLCLNLFLNPGSNFSSEPSKRLNYSQEQVSETVRLKSKNCHKDFAELLLLFKKAGINVTNNSKFKAKQNVLKEIKFQLMHPQGMNFKLRIENFTQLEFRFVFNEKQECQYFTFRINQEKVHQHIPLDTEGYKSYDCFADGQIVQRGETNHPIERYE